MVAQYIPHPKYKKFLEEGLEIIKDVLNLKDYQVSFAYVELVQSYSDIPAKYGYTFDVVVDSIYMNCEIGVSRLSQQMFKRGQKYEVLIDLCHEMCHVITDPITEFNSKTTRTKELRNLNENLTQKICMLAEKELKRRAFVKNLLKEAKGI